MVVAPLRIFNAIANALLRYFPVYFARSSHMRAQLGDLLPNRTANASTNDTGQLLATHRHEVADCEADEEDQANSEEGDEPERDADVLFLARRASPDGGLDLAVAAVFGCRGALAAVAVRVRTLGGVAVAELLVALSVTGAVASFLLALLLGAEAGRQDTGEGRGLVGEGGERSGHGCRLSCLRGCLKRLGEWLLHLALAEQRCGVGHAVDAPAGGVGAGGGHKEDGYGRGRRALDKHLNFLNGEAEDERVVAGDGIDIFANSELLFNLAPAVDAVSALDR